MDKKTEVDACKGNLCKLLAKTFQSKSDLWEVMLKDSLKIKSLGLSMFLNHIPRQSVSHYWDIQC